MARDKTARERDESEVPLNRRSFLGATGAGVASALGVGALASASDAVKGADYQTITVPAGQKRTIRIGSGETFENALIDVTATGASVQISASGNDWAIRNVGIKGTHPGGHYVLTPGVPDKDANALIENVYLGDGQIEGSAKGGVWVNGNLPHRGTLTFRNVHVGQMVDNGLYGMDSGYWGEGGVVHVEDSYFYSNNISNIRVGSIDGRTCRIDNCVVRVDDGATPPCDAGCSAPGAVNPRGVWAWFGPVEVTNSDIGGPSPRVTKEGGYIEEGNTRWGSAANTDRVPDGTPMTAEEAASGTSSGDSSGTTESGGDDSEESDAPEEGTVLELVAETGTSNLSYEFTVEGSVQKRTSAGDVAAEDNDSVTDNGDGTLTVSGVAGNGYGDSFLVDGVVTSMDLNEDQWTLRYGGEEVAVQDLALPKVLVIDGSNQPRASTDYTFGVSGSAVKSAALGSVNARDTTSNGEISGRVIGGKDAYRFSGNVTGFSIDGPASVRLDEDA
jgi:hypothetical protein